MGPERRGSRRGGLLGTRIVAHRRGCTLCRPSEAGRACDGARFFTTYLFFSYFRARRLA